MRRPPLPRRLTAGVAAVTVLLLAGVTAPAAGDTRPVAPLPKTVAADALPTVQIDGVVWDQEIVGNRVYAVGKFATARPAGAAPGTSTVPRQHMLAYDLTTGALVASFAPRFNAQVRSVSASPSGRIFVGGDFSSVNGTARSRVAELDPSTGALRAFAPAVNGPVEEIVATDTSLFVGGSFTAIGTTSRTRVAALSTSAPFAVLPFKATVPDGRLHAMALAPDRTALVIGGNFTSVNGSTSNGYGLARLDASSGTSLSFPVNQVIRNSGTGRTINNLHGDATGVYGVGIGFEATDPKFEGTFAADWNGNLRWVQDCHGDTYDVFTRGQVTYTAGHPYKCDTVGGYPETSPRQSSYGNAYTNYATGTVGRNRVAGYADFEGRPAPTLLDYFPTFTPANYTGAHQATWTVTGNASYVVYGGEFTRVNGRAQQGLVRMAVDTIAPNDSGPRLSGAAAKPRAVSTSPGAVRVSWPPNDDRDNATLTYRVFRRSPAGQVGAAKTVTTSWWARPADLAVTDTAQPAGQAREYRVTATDPFGNVATSDWSTPVTVASTTTARRYATEVLSEAPRSWWRLGEPSGSDVLDAAAFEDATAGAGVTRGTAGAITGDTDTASSFNGTSTGTVGTRIPTWAPNTFSLEAWVRTTSTTGGKIIGFGSAATGGSGSHDRHVYLDNTGKIHFGTNPGALRTVSSSSSYNDGQWHHVVATLGSGGMALYVDGTRVGQRTDTTSGQAYSGYWRVGGDTVGSGWPGRPTSGYLNGALDEVAVYPTALTAAQVLDHYTASGRGAPVARAPQTAPEVAAEPTPTSTPTPTPETP